MTEKLTKILESYNKFTDRLIDNMLVEDEEFYEMDEIMKLLLNLIENSIE